MTISGREEMYEGILKEHHRELTHIFQEATRFFNPESSWVRRQFFHFISEDKSPSDYVLLEQMACSRTEPWVSRLTYTWQRRDNRG